MSNIYEWSCDYCEDLRGKSIIWDEVQVDAIEPEDGVDEGGHTVTLFYEADVVHDVAFDLWDEAEAFGDVARDNCV